MPNNAARIFPDCAAALLTAYEEEIAGEGCFAALADQFSGRPRQALLTLARLEHVTARTLRPLIESHGLRAESQAELLARVCVAVEHELALIDFARREAAGDAGSLEPVERFLSRHDGPQDG